MLSIGIFTYSTKPRGSVVHAMALAEALGGAGHDATLYALAKPGSSLYRPLACRVELLPAGAAPEQGDALFRQRIDEFAVGCERFVTGHDVLHAQDCLAANGLLALRSRRGDLAPIVRTVHHVDRFESPYLASCQRRSICEADALFSVSRVTQENVRTEFGRPSVLVHNGCDLQRFTVRRPEVETDLRRRFGVQPRDTVVLSVGGVEPRKNTLLALRAVRAAQARAGTLRWIVVGDHSIWDHSDYVRAFDAEVDVVPELRGRVGRAGTIAETELTGLYGIADVLLCVSRQEGFGLCVLEAMAAGVAVVVPERPPFTEYLDASTAMLVDADSAEDVGGALATLAGDPLLRRRLASAARRRARAFTWSRSAEIHLHHYVRLCAQRARDLEPILGEASHA
jgi:glycosyltransferase-like protein